jgi:uncharacterized protein YhbP (UPF0306 family)
MAIERSSRAVAVATLQAVARELLEGSSALCAIATVTQDGLAHVNTAYFAWAAPAFDLVWLSDPAAGHSQNLAHNPTAAVAVYDSSQAWGGPDRGIQLFGTAREATGQDLLHAREAYQRRFPAYEPTGLGGYRCYRFQPQRMKLFDENTLGAGVFVTVVVLDGRRLRFEHTELSHP